MARTARGVSKAGSISIQSSISISISIRLTVEWFVERERLALEHGDHKCITIHKCITML